LPEINILVGNSSQDTGHRTESELGTVADTFVALPLQFVALPECLSVIPESTIHSPEFTVNS